MQHGTSHASEKQFSFFASFVHGSSGGEQQSGLDACRNDLDRRPILKADVYSFACVHLWVRATSTVDESFNRRNSCFRPGHRVRVLQGSRTVRPNKM